MSLDPDPPKGAVVKGKAAQAVAAQPNTLTAQERRDGFKLLFDGKSLNGFVGWRQKEAPQAWSAADGELRVTPGKPGGDIRTADPYADFDLRLEWKVQEGGNSGVFWRADETLDVPWATGPEMQILDDAKNGDGRNPLTSAGADYAMYAPAKPAKPAGQWNAIRILVSGKEVTYWMNGEQVVKYTIGSADWSERYAKSKFSGMKEYAQRTKGYIVLQDHGYPVAFRSIRIRSL